MSLEILTADDLEKFRLQLLADLKAILQKEPGKKWLKTPEVMQLLDISEVTLQTLRNKRKIPFKKLGGVCYYNAEELDDFMSNL